MSKREQLDIQLLEWLKVLETRTQNEFRDAMNHRHTLESIGEYEGDVKESSESQMELIKYRFNWLRKQIDEINLTF